MEQSCSLGSAELGILQRSPEAAALHPACAKVCQRAHQLVAFLGQLTDEVGQPLTINGLWGLFFGNGGLAGKTNRLLFTAGIGDEAHGLFGVIRPAVADDLPDELQ